MSSNYAGLDFAAACLASEKAKDLFEKSGQRDKLIAAQRGWQRQRALIDFSLPNDSEAALQFELDRAREAETNGDLSMSTRHYEEALVILADAKANRSWLEEMSVAIDENVSLELRLIKAGGFAMGSPTTEHGRKANEWRHDVEISKDFYIGVAEVTQAQYKAVMRADPSRFKNTGCPVECVSWEDAMEFCRRLSINLNAKYTLPTEAQWEYACRAGTRTAFYSGSGKTTLSDCGWTAQDRGLGRSKPAQKRSPNRWGLYDMHGNVAEWCLDGPGDYSEQGSGIVDPCGPSDGELRVLRGGSYVDSPSDCRSASRRAEKQTEKHYTIGFRIVRLID